MFRYRDSCLKALNGLKYSEDNEDDGMVKEIGKEYKVKVVSSTDTMKREVRERNKVSENDEIEKIKQRVFTIGTKRPTSENGQTLEDLENSLFEKIRAKRMAKKQ